MTEHDPIRLVESADAPADLVDALRLAKSHAPEAATVDAIARGVLAGIGFPPPGGAPPAGPTAPAGPGTVSAGSKAALIKGGAVVAAAVVAAGAFVMLDSRAPIEEAPVEQAPMVEAPAPVVPSASVRQQVAPPTSAEPPPSVASPSVAPPPSETALLDAAQRALGSDPAAALRHCAEHAKYYPGGSLAQEREVIAIDALVRLGRTAEAKARADRFRQQHPGSGHLRRIDVLVKND